jgi:hypothetical protein
MLVGAMPRSEHRGFDQVATLGRVIMFRDFGAAERAAARRMPHMSSSGSID